MTNETKHTQGIAHMVVRELYEGCSDLHQTQLIGEIHRLRQHNAELVRACENALNAMCIGAKADETMLQACDSIRAILAKVQS